MSTLTCLHCGQPERAELFEVWSPREFLMETCCDGFHEAVNDFLAEDPKTAGAWLNKIAAGVIPPVRRVLDAGSQLVLDYNIGIADVGWRDAKALVAQHHRHCPPPAGWRFGAAVRNGPEVIGVAMVGRPGARGYDPAKVVEVNRLCVREDITEGLSWNACSMLYGWAAREAKRRGYFKIITYTRADEPGTTLRAAGWTLEARVKGRSWNTPSRPRSDKSEVIDKFRWARIFRQGSVAAKPTPKVAGVRSPRPSLLEDPLPMAA
jgi:hypothetical protein